MFFRTWRAKADRALDVRLADAVLATASAPTYFEPARVSDIDGGHTRTLVDGGVFATNPAMCALAEVARMGQLDEVLVVSLGTGSKTRSDPVRAGARLGPARVGAADPRRRLRRRRRHRRLPGSQQLLPDGSYHRFQTELDPRHRARRRAAGDDRRAARDRRAPRARALRRDRRRRLRADDRARSTRAPSPGPRTASACGGRYLMNSISEYFGSGQRSSATMRSSRRRPRGRRPSPG